MSTWPKYNEERHKNPWNRPWCARCATECLADSLCRCCETARADAAEAAIQRVRETCEQQVKDRSGWSDDRHKFDLSYIDGWNDALDRIEQAIDGGAE